MAPKKFKKILDQVVEEKALSGIALDVFEIVCNAPGVTAGEIFMAYKKKYPNTSRARNELAKRVSDLNNWGVIKPTGVTICPYSKRDASQYEPTGNMPDRSRAIPVVRGNLAVVPRPEVGLIIENAVDKNAHLSVLRGLAARSRFLLTTRLVYFVPGLKQRTEETLKALEFAISKVEG